LTASHDAGTTARANFGRLSNTMLLSLLSRLTPADLTPLIMVGSEKNGFQLSSMTAFPHLLNPVVTDPKRRGWVLGPVIGEMGRGVPCLVDLRGLGGGWRSSSNGRWSEMEGALNI